MIWLRKRDIFFGLFVSDIWHLTEFLIICFQFLAQKKSEQIEKNRPKNNGLGFQADNSTLSKQQYFYCNHFLEGMMALFRCFRQQFHNHWQQIFDSKSHPTLNSKLWSTRKPKPFSHTELASDKYKASIQKLSLRALKLEAHIIQVTLSATNETSSNSSRVKPSTETQCKSHVAPMWLN